MQALIVAASAAFIGALIALLVYHFCAVRPALRRLQAELTTHDQLLGDGTSGAGRLSSLEEGARAVEDRVERFEHRLRELEAWARTDISRVGFLRYDAYDDTGSELSYALALLNREGDGVVLSSLYSRTDTRTYGKAVERYKPVVNASEEELSAIARARGVTNEH